MRLRYTRLLQGFSFRDPFPELFSSLQFPDELGEDLASRLSLLPTDGAMQGELCRALGHEAPFPYGHLEHGEESVSRDQDATMHQTAVAQLPNVGMICHWQRLWVCNDLACLDRRGLPGPFVRDRAVHV